MIGNISNKNPNNSENASNRPDSDGSETLPHTKNESDLKIF